MHCAVALLQTPSCALHCLWGLGDASAANTCRGTIVSISGRAAVKVLVLLSVCTACGVGWSTWMKRLIVEQGLCLCHCVELGPCPCPKCQLYHTLFSL